MSYRYLTHSIGGFVQQLAVCYVQRGYCFYVIGNIPAKKDLAKIDQKLLDKYEINLSKYQRYRQHQDGLAKIQYLRYQRTFLLLSSHGLHPFFTEEQSVLRDARHSPIHLFGYAITYQNNHALVSLNEKTYRNLKAHFMRLAVHRKVETLEEQFDRLRFELYVPVKRQIFSILQEVNEKRQAAGFDPVPYSALRRKRRIYRPFEPLPAASSFSETTLNQVHYNFNLTS